MSIDPSHLELWDLQKPAVPPRSRLFHLQPIAIGTLFAESLMSYVVRLADYHCVTPRHLVIKEIAPRMLQKGYPSIAWRKKIERLFKSNSPLIKGNEVEGITATTFIQALEELTLRQDLSQLTLLRRASALLAGGQLRRQQAWCPLCLEEWRQAGQVIYTPLIWLLKDLWSCPQHRAQELLYCCPHCQRSFPPLAPNLSPGVCPKCHRWLGSAILTPTHSQSSSKRPVWKAFTHDLLEGQLIWLDDSEKLLRQAQDLLIQPS